VLISFKKPMSILSSAHHYRLVTALSVSMIVNLCQRRYLSHKQRRMERGGEVSFLLP